MTESLEPLFQDPILTQLPENTPGPGLFPFSPQYTGATLALYRQFLKEKGYISYIQDPLKILRDSLRKSTATKPQNHTPLPQLFHSVWITHTEKPGHIPTDQLANFFAQAKRLEGYKQRIWTNINPETFIKINKINKQERDCVEIRNIADLQTNHQSLLDFLTSPETIAKRTTKERTHIYNGVLIDLAKYLVIESCGGILADFNFHFSENFQHSTIENYDFIAILKKVTFIENGFFVAKPHHEILTETLNIMHDLLIGTNYEGINKIRATIEKIPSVDLPTYRYSMEPLAMAYIKYNNIETNDAVIIHNTNRYLFGNDVCCTAEDLLKDNPSLLADLKAKYQENLPKLDSNKLNELDQLSTLYYKYVSDIFLMFNFGPCYNNFIDTEEIGTDQHHYSWHKANLIGDCNYL